MTERASQIESAPGSGGEERLFPYALVRIAGGPQDAFQALELTGTSDVLEELRRHATDLEELRQKLSADLYDAVGAAADDALRHDLLTLRRSLFSPRGPDSELVTETAPRLPDEASRRLMRFAATHRRSEALEAEAIRRFATERQRSERRLRELARDPVLRRGLAISSRSLLDAVDRYVLSDRDDIRPSRVRRAELGLIKYLARFYCKTSPLSTLTSVAIVPIPDEGSGAPRLEAHGEPRSLVRLNNALCAYLKDRLRLLPGLRRDMPVSLAPFRRDADGDYLLVTNVRNVDLFQRVAGTPAVDAVVEIAGSVPEGTTWSELVDRLDDELEGERDRLERFLEMLAACGLLRTGLLTPALDPLWEVSLLRELDDLDTTGAPASAVRELLAELHEVRGTLAGADAWGRRRSLEKAARRVREVQAELDRATARGDAPSRAGGLEPGRPDLEAESLLYEDHFRPLAANADRAELERVVAGLRELSAVLHRTNPFPSPAARLAREVQTEHGHDARVPLLDLCEHRQRAARAKSDGGIGAPKSAKRPVPLWRWSSLIERLSKSPEPRGELALSANDVRRAAEEAGIPRREDDDPAPRSRGAFVQLLPAAGVGGSLRAVVNFLSPGYGRMLGRFLQGAQEEVVEALREENRRLAGDRVFAEIRDGSSHAANVHPTLMPYEIVAPGGEGRLPAERRIRAEDLDVEAAEGGGVVLRHRPSGREVLPFDMDFQVKSLRSRTYRLLIDLSPIEELPLPPLVDSLHRALLARQDPSGVRTLPRIVFEDRLVLARRTWLVLRSELPRQRQAEDDWTFFRQVDDWRVGHSMPARVFLTLASGVDPHPSSEEERERLHPDDRKPQYVSFRDPYLVRLLGRLFNRSPDVLVISEALPVADQLLEVDGERTVTEWVVQWTD